MIRAVIVEDEQLAREVLISYLKNYPEVEVIAECDNGFEGVKVVNELRPDLIFLDVQMPKLNGFEMLELLDYVPVVIFSTAFDQYAIQAFEKSAVDYLLKPYDAGRFNQAVDKAMERLSQKGASQSENFSDKMPRLQEILDRIVVKTGSRIHIIPVENIDFIEAQDDYVAIYSGGVKYLKQHTMKDLEGSLPPQDFVRVHRSFLLRVGQITKLEPMSKDSYIAILKTGEKIPVSRKGYQALREVLNF